MHFNRGNVHCSWKSSHDLIDQDRNKNQDGLVPYRAQERLLSDEDYEYERPAKRLDRKREALLAKDNRAVAPFVRQKFSVSLKTSKRRRPYRHRDRQQSIKFTPEPDIRSCGGIALHYSGPQVYHNGVKVGCF